MGVDSSRSAPDTIFFVGNELAPLDVSEDIVQSDTEWKIGMNCRAKYSEDGVEYEAEITGMEATAGHPYAIVKYIGFENEESVWIENLLPSAGEEARQAQKELVEKAEDYNHETDTIQEIEEHDSQKEVLVQDNFDKISQTPKKAKNVALERIEKMTEQLLIGEKINETAAECANDGLTQLKEKISINDEIKIAVNEKINKNIVESENPVSDANVSNDRNSWIQVLVQDNFNKNDVIQILKKEKNEALEKVQDLENRNIELLSEKQQLLDKLTKANLANQQLNVDLTELVKYKTQLENQVHSLAFEIEQLEKNRKEIPKEVDQINIIQNFLQGKDVNGNVNEDSSDEGVKIECQEKGVDEILCGNATIYKDENQNVKTEETMSVTISEMKKYAEECIEFAFNAAATKEFTEKTAYEFFHGQFMGRINK